ncbi:serine/threonine phosphatase [Pleurocapsales cyanobacterium LEGE 10410]|nr:serine/threonine phosphatase [Pleurocapsales cyanobacterium LEGE 10410]
MLICPQCEFENPKANKFCQKCGISLTHKVCCKCQANIPIDAKTCSSCGAINHLVLWGIISQRILGDTPSQSELERGSSDVVDAHHQLEIEDLSVLFTESRAKTKPLQIKNENNTLKRYVVVKDAVEQLEVVHQGSDSMLLQGKVIDQYPLQKSHLATLQKQQMDLFVELTQAANSSYLSVNQYWNLVGLPTHALPYLILEKYAPTVPQIYDAWQQQDQGVVLLPDRSQWKLLTELWSQQRLPPLQIIWFLDEMAKLWSPLQQISCAQSLLIKDNLRMDEDQTFCLKQLYMDLDSSPTLKDLAQTWQLCFAESGLNHLDNLNHLLDKIIAGEIIEVEQLRGELHNLSFDENQIESFDVYSNISEVNNPQTDREAIESDDNLEAVEQLFFDENEDMLYDSEFEEQATAVVPMNLRSVTDASYTDIGTQRNHNEDFFGVETIVSKLENNNESSLNVRGLYIICDGMGGHAAGEVASAMAVENLQQYFEIHWQEELPDHKTIEEGILLANEALYQTNINNSRSGSGRMGTTLVMALLQDTQLAIAHVGDSRIYRLTRKQGLEQLTLDHEVGQREINRGVEPEIAYGRPDAYQLTQALGPRDSNYVRPEIQFVDITEDCLLLLCSDGLSDNELIEQNCLQYLEPLISSSSNLQDGLFKLIEFANEHNGHDNITAILVRIKLKPNF